MRANPLRMHAGLELGIGLLGVASTLALAAAPPPVVASAVDKVRIEFSRRRLVKFYELSLLAYAGDREAWAMRSRAFIRDAEPNAYYDRVFGR